MCFDAQPRRGHVTVTRLCSLEAELAAPLVRSSWIMAAGAALPLRPEER